MAIGDNKFSENAASGHVSALGTDQFIVCNFNPQTVIVCNMDNGAVLYWTQTMAAESGVLIAPGGAGALTNQTDNGQFNSWRVYTVLTVGGPFQIGETVTDAVTGGTGVVSAVGTNRFGYEYLDFSAIGGTMGNNHGLTGGTSGATAISTSVLVGRFTPTATPVAMMGASISNSGTDLDALGLVVMAANNSRLKSIGSGKYDNVENAFEIAHQSALGLIGDRYALTYLRSLSVGGSSPISTGGIYSGNLGFNIGNNPTINIIGNNLFWFAVR